jgi:hypothetical protein
MTIIDCAVVLLVAWLLFGLLGAGLAYAGDNFVSSGGSVDYPRGDVWGGWGSGSLPLGNGAMPNRRLAPHTRGTAQASVPLQESYDARGPGNTLIYGVRATGTAFQNVFDDTHSGIGYMTDQGTFDSSGRRISTRRDPGLLARKKR